jgi:hypothetical protein
MLGRKMTKLMYIIALWILLSLDFLFTLDYWTHAAVHLVIGIGLTLYIATMK